VIVEQLPGQRRVSRGSGYSARSSILANPVLNALENLSVQDRRVLTLEPSEGEVHDQTMIPRDEIPTRDRPSFALRLQRANVISPSLRGLHRGQRCKPR
jgi:hypothetical protein